MTVWRPVHEAIRLAVLGLSPRRTRAGGYKTGIRWKLKLHGCAHVVEITRYDRATPTKAKCEACAEAKTA